MAAPDVVHEESVLEELSPLAIWCWLLFFDALAWFGIIVAVRAAAEALGL